MNGACSRRDAVLAGHRVTLQVQRTFGWRVVSSRPTHDVPIACDNEDSAPSGRNQAYATKASTLNAPSIFPVKCKYGCLSLRTKRARARSCAHAQLDVLSLQGTTQPTILALLCLARHIVPRERGPQWHNVRCYLTAVTWLCWLRLCIGRMASPFALYHLMAQTIGRVPCPPSSALHDALTELFFRENWPRAKSQQRSSTYTDVQPTAGEAAACLNLPHRHRRFT